MNTWPNRLFLCLALVGPLAACQETVPDQTAETEGPFGAAKSASDTTVAPSPFALAVKLAAVSKEQLDEKFAAMGVKAKTGVDIHRVYYVTADAKGTPVKATGLVMIPTIRIPTFPWISVQHVTITGEAQAPSNKPEEGVFEASQGFVTVVADQIGFGGTTGAVHPYLYKNAYPRVLVDLLRAAKTFTAANGVTVGPLFLRGYSEGAYATMVLQKALETTYKDEFKLIASAPAAGPYELEKTAMKSLTLPAVNPVNLSMLVLSYATYLAPGIDLSKIFAINPADVKAALDGSKSYAEALKVLPYQPAQLFKPEFIADFLLEKPTTSEATTMRSFLAQNTQFNDGWVPSTPTRFYHCKDDESVPVQLTDYAVAAIQALAPQAPVSKMTLDSPDPTKPYTHATCPLYYASLSWFGELLSQMN